MSFSFLATYIAIWALVLFQGLLIVALLRDLSDLRRAAGRRGPPSAELPLGSVAPHYAGADVRTGEMVDLQGMKEQGGIVLFVSPDCRVCRRLFTSLPGSEIETSMPVVVWCEGGDEACADFARHVPPTVPFLVDKGETIAARYYIAAFPCAVVVNRDLTIRAYGYPKTPQELRDVVQSALATPMVLPKQNKQASDGLGSEVTQ